MLDQFEKLITVYLIYCKLLSINTTPHHAEFLFPTLKVGKKFVFGFALVFTSFCSAKSGVGNKNCKFLMKKKSNFRHIDSLEKCSSEIKINSVFATRL